MSQVDLHPDDLLDRERQGTLSSAERQRLDAHLARCSACRFERQIIDDLEQESAPRSGDREMLARLVDAATKRAVAAAPDARPPPRSRRRSRAAAALILIAAAAAAAVIASSLGDGDRRSPPPPTPPPPATASAAPETTGSEPAPADSAPAVSPTQDPPPTSAAPTSSAAGLAGRADQKPAASGSAEAAELTAAELFSQANQARRAGSAPEAARLYRELQKRFPASREAAASRIALARLLLDRLGDPASALALFDGYLASHSSGTLAEEAYLGRALSLMRLGRASEERAAWELILRRYPNSVHAQRARERLDKLR